jgi:hypothetical protein
MQELMEAAIRGKEETDREREQEIAKTGVQGKVQSLTENLQEKVE